MSTSNFVPSPPSFPLPFVKEINKNSYYLSELKTNVKYSSEMKEIVLFLIFAIFPGLKGITN